MSNKKINVLVTGVGAIIGYGIIHNLKKSKFNVNIIGIDIFDDAVGQVWCDKFIQGKRADSSQFIEFILDVIKKNEIDLVIPGIEQDLMAMVHNFKKLPKNTSFVLNNRDLFNTFHDKEKTDKFLKGVVPLIPTIKYSDNLYSEAASTFGLPFVLKKHISYASKGVAYINNKIEYDYFIYNFGKDCIAQRKLNIKNNEITCSVFGLNNGDFVNPICLLRELSEEGATKKAENIQIDEALMNTIIEISEKCHFIGPTNLQFIKQNDKYHLLEVNPRTSSSTSIREIFGVNEAEMCIDYFIFKNKPEIKHQKYGKVIRYIKDLYFDSNHI